MFDEIADDADSPAIIEMSPLGSAVMALISAPPDSLGKLFSKLRFFAEDLSDDPQPEMNKILSASRMSELNEMTGETQPDLTGLECGLVI